MAAPAAHRKFFDLPTAAPEPDNSKNDVLSDSDGATRSSAGQTEEPPTSPTQSHQATVKTNGFWAFGVARVDARAIPRPKSRLFYRP